MNGTKRFGTIMMCFIPLLSGIGLQILFFIPAVGIALLYAMLRCNGDPSLNAMDYYIDLVSTSNFSTWISVLYAVSVIVIFGFWYRKCFSKEASLPVKQTFHPLIIPGLILAAIAWQYLAQYIASFTAVISPKSMEFFEDLMETAGFEEITPVLVLYAVLVGPVCEELLFRGVTLGFARRAMPFWLANLFQALLFGVFHMNVIQGVYAFALGIVMGLICEKCGNILYSMAFHILYNGWATFSPDWFMYRADETPYFFIWLAVGILLAVISGVLLVLAVRKRKSAAKVNFSNQTVDM
ncbi:MAG: type II CAAX prenyl endopeptidase Rce1 family protein [Roseburia sp.]